MVENGYTATQIAGTKALLHGISRAAIAKAQGMKTSAAFWSGLASSILSGVGSKIAGKAYGARVAVSAVIGGTSSAIAGGKFANGAVTGAFIYMFNHALHEAQDDLKTAPKGSRIVNPSKQPNGYYVKTPEGFMYNSDRMNYQMSRADKVVFALAKNAALAVPAGRAGYYTYQFVRVRPMIQRDIQSFVSGFNAQYPNLTSVPHSAGYATRTYIYRNW